MADENPEASFDIQRLNIFVRMREREGRFLAQQKQKVYPVFVRRTLELLRNVEKGW